MNQHAEKDEFETKPKNSVIEKAVPETPDRRDKNQLAEKDEFEAKPRELNIEKAVPETLDRRSAHLMICDRLPV
eukprot:647428-Heterocapsa_arctica.AAC.1